MPRLDHVVEELSYANRRRVEISRALVGRGRGCCCSTSRRRA